MKPCCSENGGYGGNGSTQGSRVTEIFFFGLGSLRFSVSPCDTVPSVASVFRSVFGYDEPVVLHSRYRSRRQTGKEGEMKMLTRAVAGFLGRVTHFVVVFVEGNLIAERMPDGK